MPVDDKALITIRRNQISFNAFFVNREKLDQKGYCVIYVDSQAYKIGFKFLEDATDPDALSLCTDGGSKKEVGKVTGGRVIQTQATMREYDWISRISALENINLRRFEPKFDRIEGIWVISLFPTFEIRVSNVSEISSGLSGIYRYKNGDDIVYIGRGRIRSRLNSPERETWEFDTIEYSVVAGEEEQARYETFWLDRFVEETGTLPFYNRIGGKRVSPNF